MKKNENNFAEQQKRTIFDFYEQLRIDRKLKFDYELADALNVHKQSLSIWKKKGQIFLEKIKDKLTETERARASRIIARVPETSPIPDSDTSKKKRPQTGYTEPQITVRDLEYVTREATKLATGYISLTPEAVDMIADISHKVAQKRAAGASEDEIQGLIQGMLTVQLRNLGLY